MIQSLYTAAAGLSGQQVRIDVIANNIANIDTAGFKSSDVNFKDAFYTAMENPEDPGGASNLQRGTGVIPAAMRLDFSAGSVSDTGSGLDFAIEGDGFFTLRDAGGGTVYTRNGAFSVSVEEDGNYLVAADGAYVLDGSGERISLPDGDAPTVAADGTITSADGTAVKLGIADFPNPEGLSAVGDSRFAATGASGEAAGATDFSIRQGALEASNVDLGSELTQLIQAQRMYSLAGRALETSDEMEGLANNVRR